MSCLTCSQKYKKGHTLRDEEEKWEEQEIVAKFSSGGGDG